MASERIPNLPDTITTAQLGALFNSLYLAVDESSLTQQHKLALSLFITSARVNSEAHNTWRAMSPDAFYKSLADTLDRGIVRLATNTEITAKESIAVLTAGNQILMQQEWYQDYFVSNGPPATYRKNSADTGAGGGVAFQSTGQWASMGAYGIQNICPILDSGALLDRGYVQAVVSSNLVNDVAMIDYSYSTGEFVRDLGSGFWLNIPASRTQLQLKAKVAHSNVRVSITANFTVR